MRLSIVVFALRNFEFAVGNVIAVERLLLLEANTMSCVFQNIDPHPPLRLASVESELRN
jgi:hypothetical protein